MVSRLRLATIRLITDFTGELQIAQQLQFEAFDQFLTSGVVTLDAHLDSLANFKDVFLDNDRAVTLSLAEAKKTSNFSGQVLGQIDHI